MLGTFSYFSTHVKVKPGKISVDNLIFKLHYRVTFLMLVLCTILVCSRQYFGEHIRCLVDNGVPQHVINTFCFFTSTFTVSRHYNESMLAMGYIPHPGVGPLDDRDNITHHAYYQWVPFVLFGQAIMFYIPHNIWKKIEGGRIKALVNGLHMTAMPFSGDDLNVNGVVVPSKDSIDGRITTIRVDFLTRLHASRPWSTWLILCEVLNFLNIILQIHITNKFLGGHFLGLGPKLFYVNWEGAMDPLDVVFPKVTKCIFHKYGPSGSIQTHDALCVMALNIINEKIYAVLWFWFLILFIATTFGLIWRIATLLLHSRSARFNEWVYSTASPGKIDLRNMISVTRECHFADWLFLYYLAKNMDGFIFRDLFVSLAEEMDRTGKIGKARDEFPLLTNNTTDDKAPMIEKKKPLDDVDFYDDSTLKISDKNPGDKIDGFNKDKSL